MQAVSAKLPRAGPAASFGVQLQGLGVILAK